MWYNDFMVMIAFEQLQQNLTDALRRVEAGETLVIVRNNEPLIEMKPARAERPCGLAAGQFTVPDDFDAPLPDDILDAFEGKYKGKEETP